MSFNSVHKNYFVVFVLVLAIGILEGCAIGNRHVALTYTPVEIQKSGSAKTVAIVKFKDKRYDQKIGVVKNMYGMEMAQVLPQDPNIDGWISNAFERELSSAGYNMQKVLNASDSNAEYVLSGEIRKVFIDMYMNYNGEIITDVLVKKNGNTILEKSFLGHSKKFALTGTASEYEEVLREALRDLMKKAVPEIIAIIQ
ncbi:putative Lipoprotein [Candidatus Magnetomoraceae bacterium gMMP-15]